MSSPYDADVAIIGFGPTGVAAANTLGCRGITTVAFERETDIYHRARAVTVSDWTMRHLQEVGLSDRAKQDMDEMYALQWKLYDGTPILFSTWPTGPFGHSMSYSIYQPLLEQTLREGAARFGDRASVEYGVVVTDVAQDTDGVTVTTRDQSTGREKTTRARYALACHGGEGTTREMLGVNLLGDTVETRWIVIDAKVKRWWPNRHVLTFWSDKQRPVVDIALGRANHRWEIPLRPDETDATFDSPDKVWPLLEELGVNRDDVDIHGYAFYNHHVRSAENWRIGERVFLLGDAAHLMPPWAGAGMQSGMRDAFNLAWKIQGVLDGRLPESILDSYEAERRANVDFFTGLSVQLGRIIKQELTAEELTEMVRAQQAGEALPFVWPPSYETGWFTGPCSPPALTAESAVGQMIPQPRSADVRGLIAPLDELLGSWFVLLGDGVDPSTLLAPEQKADWDRIGARYVAVRSPDQHTEGPDEIVDIDGTLLAWMRDHGARVVAVRPDKFVAAADCTGLAVPA